MTTTAAMSLLPLELLAAAALSASEPEIPLGLGGEQAVTTVVDKPSSSFAVFARGLSPHPPGLILLVLVLVHW